MRHEILIPTASIVALLAGMGSASAGFSYLPAHQAASGWHVSGFPAAQQPTIAAHNPIGSVKRDIRRAHKRGVLFLGARVNPQARTIRFRPARFARSGPLASFLPGGQVATHARLASAMPLLSAAARAHHEHVDLNLDRRTMTLQPSVSPSPGRLWHIGTIFSSYGPRYAGSDVLSGYGYAHVDGWDLSGSVTRGLPGMTPQQSAGGAYLGESATISRPTPAGIFSLTGSHAHYHVGGRLEGLQLRGTVSAVKLGDRYPIFDGHVWLRGGVAWSSDNEQLGALGWQTTQRNVSAYAGMSAHYIVHGVRIALRGSAWHGLAGSSSVSAGPSLLGTWSAHYSVERLHLAAARDVGPVRLAGMFGYQHGSSGTPAYFLAYIGGRHRGSSFFTGSYAGPSGYWWSATISKAKPVRFRLRDVAFRATPFAGVNGGTVSPDVGPSRSISAAMAGVAFRISRHCTGTISYSHTIAEPAGAAQVNKIGFDVTTHF